MPWWAQELQVSTHPAPWLCHPRHDPEQDPTHQQNLSYSPAVAAEGSWPVSQQHGPMQQRVPGEGQHSQDFHPLHPLGHWLSCSRGRKLPKDLKTSILLD